MTIENTTEISMVSKIVPKTLGNANKAAALDVEGAEVSLGKIFGICDGVKAKEFNGEMFYPLMGRFQAETSEGKTLRSGILYFPGGIHETYKSAAEKLEDGETFRFAVELFAVRASNSKGYSYRVADLMPRSIEDPLDQFASSVRTQKIIAGKEQPKLEAETVSHKGTNGKK